MAVNDLTHLDKNDRPQMVDVSAKEITTRIATASCLVDLGTELMADFAAGDLVTKKGSVLQTATIAGIMGSKKTPELIPMCHPIGLEKVNIDITPASDTALRVSCTCKITSKTGVEMEALTAASVTALTIYDMCKALDKGIVIESVQLLEKQGGKSGSWLREAKND